MALVLVALATAIASPASADNTMDKGRTASAECVNGDCRVAADGAGRPSDNSGTPTRSSGGTVECKYGELGPDVDPAGYADPGAAMRDVTGVVTDLTEDWWYVANCESGDRIFQYRPGEPPVSPLFLAQQAYDTMTIAFPDPQTSPPAGLDQLVGFRTWLWIAPEGFEPVSASASIPGLSVTATATPTQVVWDMGDGSEPVVCDDAGTAYDTDLADDVQETDCFHVYQWAGDYTATTTTTWEIEWSATNGDGGTLASIDRITSVDLHVIERQAVVVDNP